MHLIYEIGFNMNRNLSKINDLKQMYYAFKCYSLNNNMKVNLLLIHFSINKLAH